MFGLIASKPYLLILLILPIIPNLWAIWHIFKHDFTTPQVKMFWLAVTVFIPVLGGLAYVFWGRKKIKVN